MRKLRGPVLRIPNTGVQWHEAWLSTPRHETWHWHFPQWRELRSLRHVSVRGAHALGEQDEIDERESYVEAALAPAALRAAGGFRFSGNTTWMAIRGEREVTYGCLLSGEIAKFRINGNRACGKKSRRSARPVARSSGLGWTIATRQVSYGPK